MIKHTKLPFIGINIILTALITISLFQTQGSTTLYSATLDEQALIANSQSVQNLLQIYVSERIKFVDNSVLDKQINSNHHHLSK